MVGELEKRIDEYMVKIETSPLEAVPKHLVLQMLSFILRDAEEMWSEFPSNLIRVDSNGTVHIFGDYTLESLNWFLKWSGKKNWSEQDEQH